MKLWSTCEQHTPCPRPTLLGMTGPGRIWPSRLGLKLFASLRVLNCGDASEDS